METEVDDIPRRTWAPFVGAALAALTAGSLVVFSLVAQKTSLDGFPDRGVTVTDVGGSAQPSSITISPVDRSGEGSPSASTDSPSSPAATSLLETVETEPTIARVTATATETTVLDTDTDSDDPAPAGDEPVFAAKLDGRLPIEERGLLTRGADGATDQGETEQHAGWDPRHAGKHPHRSHELKDGKKAKKAAVPRGGNRSGRPSGRPNPAPSSGSASPARSDNPAPPRSKSKSKSQARSKPAPSSQPSAARSRGSGPPGHSNAGGNGKSRGRGHKKP